MNTLRHVIERINPGRHSCRGDGMAERRSVTGLSASARPKPVTDRRSTLLLALLLVTLGAGCRMIQGASDVSVQAVRAVTPGSGAKSTVDPVEVQQTLMRFADEFSMRMVAGVDNLRHSTNAPSPAQALRWKIVLDTETCSIVSGPNAIANLLDMTVFVTLLRMSVENYWQPQVFGESALPLLANCRVAETEIWKLVGTALLPEQQAELHAAIAVWHQKNPLPADVLAARAVGCASLVASASPSDSGRSSSVFGLLMLDPLSSLDPATREIAQTRLFAERALFVAQKMPKLLRWQTELLSLDAVEMPAVQQLVSNSTQIAASAERFAAVAEKLPGQVSTERQEILQALKAQEKEVAALMVSGTLMSESLNTTITTFDALMQRFGVGETNNAAPPDTNSPPFNILDYATTATQVEAAAQQLTELLRTLDQTTGSNNLSRISAQLAPVVQQAQTGGKEVVDYAFWKGVLLVAVALLAALIYRFLSVRIKSQSKSP